MGVTQLVMGATRLARGQPQTGLDHLYSNKPDKLSSVQTFIAGMSDHKLLKFTRFTKSFKQAPRFVKKRTFKNFDDNIFKERLSGCGLEAILLLTDTNSAAELLTFKLSIILDEMAPVSEIQTRNNYAPWLSEGTKLLKEERSAAQDKAASKDDPEDWRQYRSIVSQQTKPPQQKIAKFLEYICLIIF